MKATIMTWVEDILSLIVAGALICLAVLAIIAGYLFVRHGAVDTRAMLTPLWIAAGILLFMATGGGEKHRQWALTMRFMNWDHKGQDTEEDTRINRFLNNTRWYLTAGGLACLAASLFLS